MAALRRGNFYHAGEQWMLHFEEKGGKSREIPVRHDLEQILFEYIDVANLQQAPKDAPVFRTGIRKTGKLTTNGMNVLDVHKMVKAPTPRRFPSLSLVAPFIPRDHDYRSARSKACRSKMSSA